MYPNILFLLSYHKIYIYVYVSIVYFHKFIVEPYHYINKQIRLTLFVHFYNHNAKKMIKPFLKQENYKLRILWILWTSMEKLIKFAINFTIYSPTSVGSL